MPTRWLDEAEAEAWIGYRRMRVLLDLQISRDLAADSGLSDADYDVLSTLSDDTEHEWRATELATRLRWSTSRLAHHVGRMERRGLVSRAEVGDDGRGALVRLTDDGWAAIRAAAPHHVASVRRHFIDLLSAAELQMLSAVSARVIDQLS
jgi:DNA-binding MarR family transcriptional regulator